MKRSQTTYNDNKEYTMNLEQVTIFDLKPVQPISKAKSGRKSNEYLSIRKDRIGITNKLYSTLGKPYFIDVRIDYTKKILAICKTEENNIYGYKMNVYTNGGTAISTSLSITNEIRKAVDLDLENHNYIAYPCGKYNDFILFDLSKLQEVYAKRSQKN